ncbi:hypothetical protein O5165_25900, partial [Escherichia coli]|nr:hypothetical protein [Escherichia coli]
QLSSAMSQIQSLSNRIESSIQRLCNYYSARLTPLPGPDSSRESLSDTVIANIGGESSSSIVFWLSICKTLKINWCVS